MRCKSVRITDVVLADETTCCLSFIQCVSPQLKAMLMRFSIQLMAGCINESVLCTVGLLVWQYLGDTSSAIASAAIITDTAGLHHECGMHVA